MQGREMCRAGLKCMRGWTGGVEIHGERCGDGRQMLAEREYGDLCGEER